VRNPPIPKGTPACPNPVQTNVSIPRRPATAFSGRPPYGQTSRPLTEMRFSATVPLVFPSSTSSFALGYSLPEWAWRCDRSKSFTIDLRQIRWREAGGIIWICIDEQKKKKESNYALQAWLFRPLPVLSTIPPSTMSNYHFIISRDNSIATFLTSLPTTGTRFPPQSPHLKLHSGLKNKGPRTALQTRPNSAYTLHCITRSCW